MTKIAADHLGRQAFVYVRQSTQDQLLRNHESRRRQYALAARAQQLGWAEPVVIDDENILIKDSDKLALMNCLAQINAVKTLR